MSFRTLLAATALTAVAAVAAGPAAAQFQARTVRVSNGVNQEHPVGNGVAKMTACAAEKSGGQMKVQGFWGATLGNDLQATQALRAGSLEMVITSTSPLASIEASLGAFDLPFSIGNQKEADALLDGAFGDYMAKKMEPLGLVNLAYWENGFRNTTNSRRPITKWEDFQGVKMRVIPNNIFLDTFKNMGANAVPMAFGEVFSALETKAIDGQENPFVTIDTSKFYEVQKYLSVTRHAYTPFMVLISKKIWDSYSPQEQQALKDCAVQGRDEQRRVSRAAETTSLAKLKQAGMQVNELSPEEIARMREQAKPIYAKHADTIGKETVDRLLAELDKIRKS